MAKKDYAKQLEALLEGLHNGKSAIAMCKEVGISQSHFYDLLTKDEALAEKYARAREAQADYLADEILSIVDEPPKRTPSGTVDSGDVADKRLRMDARKWHAGKLAPKKYGDKIALGGDDDMPAINVITEITRKIIK